MGATPTEAATYFGDLENEKTARTCLSVMKYSRVRLTNCHVRKYLFHQSRAVWRQFSLLFS